MEQPCPLQAVQLALTAAIPESHEQSPGLHGLLKTPVTHRTLGDSQRTRKGCAASDACTGKFRCLLYHIHRHLPALQMQLSSTRTSLRRGGLPVAGQAPHRPAPKTKTSLHKSPNMPRAAAVQSCVAEYFCQHHRANALHTYQALARLKGSRLGQSASMIWPSSARTRYDFIHGCPVRALQPTVLYLQRHATMPTPCTSKNTLGLMQTGHPSTAPGGHSDEIPGA